MDNKKDLAKAYLNLAKNLIQNIWENNKSITVVKKNTLSLLWINNSLWADLLDFQNAKGDVTLEKEILADAYPLETLLVFANQYYYMIDEKCSLFLEEENAE